MKRNRPEPLSKATSANDTSNQAVASGSSTSSGSSSSVVGAEDIQRLTNKNNSQSKAFGLASHLYHPDITYHEQLLLTEQGPDRQEQPQEAPPQTRLQTNPNRYSFAGLTTLFNRGSGIVGKGSSSGGGDQMDGGEELLKQESIEASSKKVMKMSRNSNKNNDDKNGRHTLNGDVPAGGGDDLESDSKSGASSQFCTKSKCILALLMGLFIIAATVLILSLGHKTKDVNDCLESSPFLQLNNKLFATKTLYATTLNFLTQEPLYSTDNNNPVLLSYHAPPTPSPRKNDTPPAILQTNTNVNYATTSITRPERIFATGQSLRTLHAQLTRMGCFHDQFHFFGRHAARLPNEDGIIKITKAIEDIKKRLYAPTLQTSASQNDVVASDQTIFTTMPPKHLSSHHRAGGKNMSRGECSDTMLELRQWNFFARSEQGNQLIETGGQEASSMANRFKDMFPEMFDGSKADIKFGTTSAARTAQTAVHFLQKMDNYESPVTGCSINDFPTEDTMSKSGSDAIKANRCLEKFNEQTTKPMLSFHEQCESLAGTNVSPLDHKLKLKDPHRTKNIVESVSKQLKWAKKNDKLTSDELRAMYDVCRYESAIKRTMSIWCRYFSDQDLKFFEYLSDVQDYFESAYGHPDLANSACPVTASLYDSMRTYIGQRTKLRFKRPEKYRPTANFHFTHSEVLQRLIAASIDLRDDPEYQVDNILHHLRHGTVPKNRQWQTSLLTPFSANLAFNLYECPEQTGATIPGSIAFDVGNGTSPFKIVASLNEQPIRLGGCSSYICDYEHLREGSELVKHIPDRQFGTCDLKQFCKTKHVLT